MGFLKKLFGGVDSKPKKRYYTFYVKCNRCGEIIEGRVDLDNDLSLDYEGDSTVILCAKDWSETIAVSNRSKWR